MAQRKISLTSDNYMSSAPLTLHMEAFEQAWQLLKGREVYINDEIGFVPVSQQTLYGQGLQERANDLSREPKRRYDMYSKPKTNTGLDYYMTVPREDLQEGAYRRYALRRGDTNEIVGSFPMQPLYQGMGSNYKLSGSFKPQMSEIDREHRGQGLYARAMMSMLSGGEAGVPAIESNERNQLSESAHRKLMEMYVPHPYSNMESMSGYRPVKSPNSLRITDAEHIRYNQLPDVRYGSLRSRDPGGLPLRVIDLPSNQTPLPGVQSTLDDF